VGLNLDKHIGYPLPSEMFNDDMNKKIEVKIIEDFDKHQKISKLLEIPLTCPHCGEVLKTNKAVLRCSPENEE